VQDNNILHKINIPDSTCYIDCYSGMLNLCANTKQKVCLANCSFTTSKLADQIHRLTIIVTSFRLKGKHLL